MQNLEFVIFIEMIFGAILAFLCYRAWTKINYARETATWKRSKGTIITSDIKTYSTTDSEGNPDTGYRVKIDYQYDIGGNTYINDEISPVRHQVKSKSGARALQQRYPEDKTVMVYVNPENPENAYLEVGITRRVLNSLVIPIAFIVFFMIIIPIFAHFGS